jgi:hypothetical protein
MVTCLPVLVAATATLPAESAPTATPVTSMRADRFLIMKASGGSAQDTPGSSWARA